MREIGRGIDEHGRCYTTITDGKVVYRAYEVEEWFGWETPATRQAYPVAGIANSTAREQTKATPDRLAHQGCQRGR